MAASKSKTQPTARPLEGIPPDQKPAKNRTKLRKPEHLILATRPSQLAKPLLPRNFTHHEVHNLGEINTYGGPGRKCRFKYSGLGWATWAWDPADVSRGYHISREAKYVDSGVLGGGIIFFFFICQFCQLPTWQNPLELPPTLTAQRARGG